MSTGAENTESTEPGDESASIVTSPYVRRLCEYFRVNFHDEWRESTDVLNRPVPQRENESVRLGQELSRSETTVHYLQCEALLKRMGLQFPVTLYDGADSNVLNAVLLFEPEHVRLLIGPRLQNRIPEHEAESLLAHSLAEFCFLRYNDSETGVLERSLKLLSNQANCPPAIRRTQERFDRRKMVFSDRLAVSVVDETGVYLAAILNADREPQEELGGTPHLTLEESPQEKPGRHDARDNEDSRENDGLAFRVATLRQTSSMSVAELESQCAQFDGCLSLQTLDVLQQQLLFDATVELLNRFMQRDWLKTPTLLQYAGELCPADVRGKYSADAGLASLALQNSMPDVRHYFCAVLLDLSTIDSSLQEFALAAACLLAGEIGLQENFRELAAKELRLGTRSLDRIFGDAEHIVASAPEVTS